MRQHLEQSYDVLIIGAGLSGCLLAIRLKMECPDLRVLLVEQSNEIGGNHTWCFHDEDVAESWVRGLAGKSWSRYEVRFPSYHRVIEQQYHAIRSSDLRQKVKNLLENHEIFLGGKSEKISPNTYMIYSLQTKEVHVVNVAKVVWATGWDANYPTPCGFQKFVGWDVRLKNPHGFLSPVIMDACIPQADGFSFVYLLPWSADELLVELTFYSENPNLDPLRIQEEFNSYLDKNNWEIEAILRKESGVLPIPFFPKRENDSAKAVWTIGVAGAFFHPTTGYSLPYIVEKITLIASEILRFRADSKPILNFKPQKNSFYYLLNRMLFLAAKPQRRYRIFERFYRLHPKLIARFYSGKNTIFDKFRILIGRPPVPVLAALKAIINRDI